MCSFFEDSLVHFAAYGEFRSWRLWLKPIWFIALKLNWFKSNQFQFNSIPVNAHQINSTQLSSVHFTYRYPFDLDSIDYSSAQVITSPWISIEPNDLIPEIVIADPFVAGSGESVGWEPHRVEQTGDGTELACPTVSKMDTILCMWAVVGSLFK